LTPSKNTKTLMILPSAHHMKNAANCLDALYIQTIPASQMEPELQKAIAQIKPNERDDVAFSST